jgi:hypothetical protein
MLLSGHVTIGEEDEELRQPSLGLFEQRLARRVRDRRMHQLGIKIGTCGVPPQGTEFRRLSRSVVADACLGDQFELPGKAASGLR